MHISLLSNNCNNMVGDHWHSISFVFQGPHQIIERSKLRPLEWRDHRQSSANCCCETSKWKEWRNLPDLQPVNWFTQAHLWICRWNAVSLSCIYFRQIASSLFWIIRRWDMNQLCKCRGVNVLCKSLSSWYRSTRFYGTTSGLRSMRNSIRIAIMQFGYFTQPQVKESWNCWNGDKTLGHPVGQRYSFKRSIWWASEGSNIPETARRIVGWRYMYQCCWEWSPWAAEIFQRTGMSMG